MAYAITLGVTFMIVSRAGAQSAAEAPSDTAVGQVQSLQQRILAQPDFMDAVTALQSDPDFQKVFEDPDIAAALQAGNYDALLTNPKINALTSNPKIQELTKKLTQ